MLSQKTLSAKDLFESIRNKKDKIIKKTQEEQEYIEEHKLAIKESQLNNKFSSKNDNR